MHKRIVTVVHLSIDDVCESMRTVMKANYDSIFQNGFFSFLLNLHERYGCIFSLYLFEESNGFRVDQFADKYKDELLASSSWLRFGFHQAKDDFEKGFHGINQTICRFAGPECITSTLRLHGFFATESQIDFLRENGVRCLLCSDDDRISYSLPVDVCKHIREYGFASFNGIYFRRTDLRIEHASIRNVVTPLVDSRDNIIFTHEWYLIGFRGVLGRIKTELMIRSMRKHSPKFVSELSA